VRQEVRAGLEQQLHRAGARDGVKLGDNDEAARKTVLLGDGLGVE
jgi:hypothetical protein